MKFYNRYGIALLSALAITSYTGYQASAQANIEVFGQNRMQYRKFDWKYFETEHFRIYHYDATGRQLARYVAEQVENDIAVIESKVSGKFPHRFHIIVYNTYDEYRQTNIGRKYDSQLTDAPAGTLNLVGDKLVVYFNGEHTDLRRQTREGMARVVMERMLFGENFREVVKNAVLQNMPSWTVDGYMSYLIDGWDTKANSEWKGMLAASGNSGFYAMAEKKPELAGMAFWKYVADKYGDATMKNLLYLMQTKSNVNVAVKAVLGMDIKKAFKAVIEYYNEIYAKDDQVQEVPDSTKALIAIDIPDDGTVLRDIKLAPKGRDVAYVTWKNGEYKVWLQNTDGPQSRAIILDGGKLDYNEKNPDPNYPLLAWSNTGYKLAILFKKDNKTTLRVYNSIKARVENYNIPPNRFDRVLGMTFNEDDDRLVFSAIKKSQTDLYEFIIRGSKMVNITNDPWDDVQPWFVSGGSRRGLLFLSNRPKPNMNVPLGVNELPTGPMNVFFYNTKTKRKELLQMTDVKSGHITQPIQYGSDNYAYLYDSNGIRNEYVVVMKRTANNMDSAYGVPVTNFNSSIIAHQYNPASRQAAYMVQSGKQYKVYFMPLQIPGKNAEVKTLQTTSLRMSDLNKKGLPANIEKENTTIMKGGNSFQTEFKDKEPETATTTTKQPAVTEDTNEPEGADSAYLKMKPQPYKLAFKPDFFSVKIDNTVLFNRYQSAAQNGGTYVNPPLGAMLTISLDDMMENYRFTGGFRLPVNFSGLLYFLQYENCKKRVDWDILYLRTEAFNNYTVTYVDQTGHPVLKNQQIGRTAINMLQGSASYPLDKIRSIRMHLGLRSDNLQFKSEDTLSLSFESPEKNQYWGLSRVEYVFDNTYHPALNIYNGTRYKFFAEYMYRLNGGGGGCYNLGVDYRYYHKLYKNFVWATRAAFATSGGNQKILYHMGGVDNWINPKYSSYVPVRPTEKYAFETIATNLRGYEQNSRNGNSFAVINTELRLPAVATFVKRPIQSPILKNLQLVTFLDIGSAWKGFLPNADRMRNDRYLPTADDPNADPQVSLLVTDETAGIGVGYGAGLRSQIFGYFLRLDAAWNTEGRRKPIWYFSIGTDF